MSRSVIVPNDQTVNEGGWVASWAIASESVGGLLVAGDGVSGSLVGHGGLGAGPRWWQGWGRVKAENAVLRRRLGMISTKFFGPRPRRTRLSRERLKDRKRGGRPSHQGSGLAPVVTPDRTPDPAPRG